MNSISKLEIGDIIVFRVDYSGLSESEMVSIVQALAKLIQQESKPISILSIYDSKNFATPRFMRAVEAATANVLPLIAKQAVVGLTFTKKLILKGYKLMFNFPIESFDSEQDAMAFICGKPSKK